MRHNDNPRARLLAGGARLRAADPAVRRLRAARLRRARRPQRILFLKFIEQGATVLAQDAIARATRAVGRDHVFFCVFESNRAILDVIGTCRPANIITHPRQGADDVRRSISCGRQWRSAVIASTP